MNLLSAMVVGTVLGNSARRCCDADWPRASGAVVGYSDIPLFRHFVRGASSYFSASAISSMKHPTKI